MFLRLRRARTLARTGAIIGLASLGYYIGLLFNQGAFPPAALMFVAIILAGAFAALRSVDNPHRARKLLLGATAAFGIVGVVGMFSIGLLFFLAAVFTGLGALITPKSTLGD
ncbi:MAG: hypothetical protein GWP04_04790 [Gammaproteobacteria bacterium]|nr:hypothetical protein [Gammaproteobacteria bacterium]